MEANDMLAEALSLAKRAARETSDRLNVLRGGTIGIDSDSGRDVKLAADREAERIIIEILSQGFDHPILSEESGWAGRVGKEGVRWIVDPLDGSMNFLRGIPMCAVSIGLWKHDEPLAGVVHDINTHEVFSGIVGRGAWLGEKPMRVSKVSAMSSAVLCTGFPISTDFSPAALIGYVEQVRSFKKIRLLGSAALSLAYVAAGRADAYYERGIKIWDIAAGAAIVKAAGGSVVHSPVDPKTHALTVDASNGLLTHAFA